MIGGFRSVSVCFCVSRFVACDRNYDFRQRKTRLLNFRVRMFVKSAVIHLHACPAPLWLVGNNVRQSKTALDSEFLAVDSGSLVISGLGFRISIVSGISDS